MQQCKYSLSTLVRCTLFRGSAATERTGTGTFRASCSYCVSLCSPDVAASSPPAVQPLNLSS
jgi:hypothetical protein